MINERFKNSDNIEIIRDQLSSIIIEEMENQYKLAKEENDPEAEDYNLTVYLENDESLQAGGDNDNFPLMNISLESVNTDNSSSVNKSIKKARFFLDCYQCGNYFGRLAGKNASLKSWKLARCVRRILESDFYTYLNLRGIVSQIQIQSMTGGYPSGIIESSVQVAAVRIILEVKFDASAPMAIGPEIENLPVIVTDENGKVIIDVEGLE